VRRQVQASADDSNGIIWEGRFVCFVFTVFALGAPAAQDQRRAEKSQQAVLKYLGTAGWEITNGTTSILIDPYLSRINGPVPPGGGSGHSLAGDTRLAYAHTRYDGRPIRRQTSE
jgi:hypothetical protein